MSENFEAVQAPSGVWIPKATGLYADLTNEEYQASDATSKSRLDVVDDSPLHYWQRYLCPTRKPEVKTPALILGDAIHKAVLEPDLFETNIGRVPLDAPPKPSSRTMKARNPSAASQDAISWWVDFQEETKGKIIVSYDDYDAVLGARDAVHTHPVAKHLFTGGNAEQSYYATDPDTGELLKCRADYEQLETAASITDLKSAEDASPRGFKSSIFGYRYDVQDPWYRHVIRNAFEDQVEIRRFVFVAVEKKPPFALGVYWIEPEDVITGMELARRNLATLIECKRLNEWPDYGCNPRGLRINRTLPKELT